MIPIRFHDLKKIFDKHEMLWNSTRELINQGFTKARLYELRPYLEARSWDKKFDAEWHLNAFGSEKISAYWRVSVQGLFKLQELFGTDVNPWMSEIAGNLLAGKSI